MTAIELRLRYPDCGRLLIHTWLRMVEQRLPFLIERPREERPAAPRAPRHFAVRL